MDLLTTCFPGLAPATRERFALMESLYREWNARINVVSRKDIDMILEHHILHSLAIARVIRFKPGTEILDAGTGGGFPGIPLALMFPETRFTLADSIGKKIRVVEAIASALELENVTAVNGRFEAIRETFDFVTGRAVSNLPMFVSMVRKRVKKAGFNDLPNGILYLTGGEIEGGFPQVQGKSTIFSLADHFSEPWFETKKLVHLYNF